ncbi:MAG: copper resistance protein B [Gammaproteobacteria bacterium]|nr:copper resistance protein B [Gammaproteobacteria bacterium]
MKNKIVYAFIGCALSTSLYAAGMEDDPLVTKVMIDQLETRIIDGDDPLVLEAQAWIGYDLNKFVIKADVEQVKGVTHELELQALYSRAVDPYWDFQIGIRQDQKPAPNKNWLAIGFQGVAPYWFEIDSTLFIGEKDQMGLRFAAEYEWMITQRWVLSPEIEFNIHSKDDEAVGTGSGLSDSQIGIRLRYEIKREFAPYIGVNWNNKYGNTATFARNEGKEVSSTQIVAGIRAWF